jgi:hypothetical protein
LLAGAPGALNTLNELAAALGDDANFSATVTTALAQKAPLASPVLTGTPTAPTPVIATLTNQVATARFVHDVSAAKVAALDATVDPRAAFLASLWRFSGEYEDGLPAQPATVAEDGRVLTWALATPVDPGVAFAAALWQFTGDYAAGDDVPSIVTEDGRILLSGQWPVGATAGAVGGLVRAIIDTGQSNAEGRSGDATSVVYGAGAVSSLLTLQRGTEADTWQGQATGGGDSIELDGATITALGPLAPQIAGTGTHGTCASEGCARALMRDGGAFAVWSDAEGGQYIGNLMPAAPPGYFAFANAVTKLSRAAALLPAGARLEVGWLLMAQGESDTGRADLGAEHDALRADYSSAAQAALGLAGAVRMISTQPSSFGEETGALSILSQALDVADAGLFFCGGPTYGFPWSSDYLHHASLGHAMRGELCAAIIRRVESEGAYLPLHMQAASVTGPAEITVTMSEPVVLDADDANVAAVANAGISLTGGTPAGVTVSGDRIIITTTGSAAAVTAVGIALSGHSGTRTPATIPRSIIRARRGLGVYSFGGPIKAWACHQQIQIS